MTPQEKSLQSVLEFLQERDWAQFSDLKNRAIDLSIEASEVLELFLWTKDNTLQEGKEEELSDELADVYYALLLLAHDANIDLNTALEKKLAKNRLKYPVEKSKGNSIKYTEL
jgi:NTP pyrophosphatase (non-canonical NTP hydrolase)